MHFVWEVGHFGAAGLAELVTRLHQDAVLIRQTPGEFLKNTVQELMDGTPAIHNAEKNGTAWSDYGKQLIEGLSCSFKDVAQRAAKGGHHVERRWFEAREVGDIEQLAFLDRILIACGTDPIAVEVKLTRRDIADENPSAQPSQLDGEASGAGADLEHAVALMDPTGLKAFMKLKAHAAGGGSVEAIPFGRAVLIIKSPNAIGRIPARHAVTAE
jgi:hypothetical protein